MIELRPKGSLESAQGESQLLDVTHSLAHHEGFHLAGKPTAYADLLFPLFAAAVMQPFGNSPYPVLYAQLILSCATALLLYVLGRKRFGSSAGLLLCGAWLFYPGAILATSLFLTITLFVFLWVLSLLMYDRLEDNGFRLRDAVLLGICAGLTALTRTVGVVLLLSLVLYLSFLRFGPFGPTHWRSAAILFVSALIIMAPWMARNAVKFGSFSLNTNNRLSLVTGEIPINGAFPPLEVADGNAAFRAASSTDATSAIASLNLGKIWVRKLTRLWATDISLWTNYFEPVGGVRDPDMQHWHLFPVAVASIPGMLAVGLGVTGLILVQRFRSRRLLLVQLLLGVAAIFLTSGLPRDHFVFLPALMISAAALWRPMVWARASGQQRFAVVVSLGIFAGLWLVEGLVLVGV